jgi:hypothetical protein
MHWQFVFRQARDSTAIQTRTSLYNPQRIFVPKPDLSLSVAWDCFSVHNSAEKKVRKDNASQRYLSAQDTKTAFTSHFTIARRHNGSSNAETLKYLRRIRKHGDVVLRSNECTSVMSVDRFRRSGLKLKLAEIETGIG